MFTILCSCGCDSGFVFKELDGNIYVSSISSDFYSHQNQLSKLGYNFLKNVKEYILVKNNKRNILKEACIKREDIENLLKYLEEQLPALNDDKVDNLSKIRVFKDTIEEYDYVDYDIELLTATKNPKNIFFKTHRKYDIVLNRKEAMKLIKSCKKALE